MSKVAHLWAERRNCKLVSSRPWQEPIRQYDTDDLNSEHKNLVRNLRTDANQSNWIHFQRGIHGERITNNRMLVQKVNPESEFLDRAILLIKIANKVMLNNIKISCHILKDKNPNKMILKINLNFENSKFTKINQNFI